MDQPAEKSVQRLGMAPKSVNFGLWSILAAAFSLGGILTPSIGHGYPSISGYTLLYFSVVLYGS
jgi:hypothetical protein